MLRGAIQRRIRVRVRVVLGFTDGVGIEVPTVYNGIVYDVFSLPTTIVW